MNEPAYPFVQSDDALNYNFESVSLYKIIYKTVEFRPFLDNPIFYNLALLDLNEDGSVNDLSISNNHDMKRVLATTFQTILAFLINIPTN